MSTSFDAHSLRSTLGSFVTGVTIVTTRGPDGTPIGVTANSFNSVSLDPPMVLWSLAKSARCRAAFSASRTWAVHVLSAAQQPLSARFASSTADKFEGLELEEGVDGVPLLSGCVARLQCRAASEYAGGDHIILVGEVLAFERTDATPLLFHGGGYALPVRKRDALARDEQEFPAAFTDDFLGYLLGRAHIGFHSQMSAHAGRYGLDEPALRAMTSAGYELTSRIAADLKSLEADALSALTAGEVAILKQCLRVIAATAEASTAQCGDHAETAVKNAAHSCSGFISPGGK